jgi:hypothetical protein
MAEKGRPRPPRALPWKNPAAGGTSLASVSPRTNRRFRIADLKARTGLSRGQIGRLRRAHGWGEVVTGRQLREEEPRLWASMLLLESLTADQRATLEEPSPNAEASRQCA